MSILINFDKINLINGKILKKHFESFDFQNSSHLRVFHGTGVVAGFLEDCNIKIIRDRMPYEFELRPGAIIDGYGRLILIESPILHRYSKVNPGEKNNQIFLYVQLERENGQIDELTHVIKLKPGFFCSNKELKGDQYVEVGRIRLDHKKHKIGYPENPDTPQTGELDRTHVKHIPVSVLPFTSHEKQKILRGIDFRRKIINSLQYLNEEIEKIPQLTDFKLALMIFYMNLSYGHIGKFHLKEILDSLIEFEIEFIDALKKQVQSNTYFTQILSKAFGYLARCREDIKKISDFQANLDQILNLYFQQMNENYQKLFSEFQRNYDFYAQSCALFDRIIIVDNQKFKLIKTIEFDNPEKKKEEGILYYPEGEPPWESSHPIVYGDGSELKSVLVTFKQAFLQISVTGLAKGKDVLIFSASPGSYSSLPLYGMIHDNEKMQFKIPEGSNEQTDYSVNRYLLIPAKYIIQNALKLKIHTKHENELHLVKFWIYQKM